MAQVIKYLPSKSKALSSNLSIAKKKKKSYPDQCEFHFIIQMPNYVMVNAYELLLSPLRLSFIKYSQTLTM
jgi:hypothetical protein